MKTTTVFLILAFTLACLSASCAVQAPLINLNTATAEQLDSLPGIGPATAKKIIEYRRKTPFRAVSELDNVKGIGPKKLAKIAPLVTV